MHGDIFANGCIRPLIFNQYADARAMQIAGQAMRGLNPLKAANSQGFADFSDEMGAHLIHRSAGWSAFKGKLQELRHIGGRLFYDPFSHFICKINKVRIFGDEICFAIQFNQCAGVAIDMRGDDALSGNARSRLARLWPSLTRSNSSARSRFPSASVSAFLHSIIGASVFARSSATRRAVISTIVFSRSKAFFSGLHGAAMRLRQWQSH